MGASRIARTTQSRCAPRATTSPAFSGLIPPIAKNGFVATSAAWVTSSSPTAARPGLVGVSQTGPTAK